MPVHGDWIQRWAEGRIGWHQAAGSRSLRRHWRGGSGTVLVPLCGKSVDLRWLAERGHQVVGVELAERAVTDFFAEQSLEFSVRDGQLPIYEAATVPLAIHCGDYLSLTSLRCDAHYDRGALVAMPAEMRPAYANHTDELLSANPERLVITLAYDQGAVDGPPFSVADAELLDYWPALVCLERRNVIDELPPKFRTAGLAEVTQTVWRSP